MREKKKREHLSMEDEQMKRNKIKKEILEWVIPMAMAILAAWFITSFLIVNAKIPSASMENTIMTGNRIIGNRLAYKNHLPERGDIVIFRYPDDESKLFIKRVIGLPGEEIFIKDGKVYINGEDIPLEEPYVKEEPEGDFGPVKIPAQSYFVMGDNRNRSLDARFWKNTFVYEDKILGKAVFCYWPSIHKVE